MVKTKFSNLSYLTKPQAIGLMNHYGEKKTPFLFVIDYSTNKIIVKPCKSIDNDLLKYNINGFRNCNQTNPDFEKPVFLEKHPISYKDYKTAFDKVQNAIQAGDSYLLNLTFPNRIQTNLSLREIFDHSRAKFKLYLKGNLVCFSPESFIQISEGKIAAFPMKGTIDAAIPDAKNIILNDPKEIAEHATIVDFLRNDLNMVSNKVNVESYRYIDRINTRMGDLLQVSSKITGDLPANFNQQIGDILFKLLPAGSICGAPKKKTLEIIQEAEQYDRGFYTGVFGYFDGENLDSGVMIRFIEQQNGRLFYKSGGGITAFSDPRREYDEMIKKIYFPIPQLALTE